MARDALEKQHFVENELGRAGLSTVGSLTTRFFRPRVLPSGRLLTRRTPPRAPDVGRVPRGRVPRLGAGAPPRASRRPPPSRPRPRGPPSRVVRRRRAIFSSSSAPWWSLLDRVHILVFNPEEPDEAVYTTSRRTDDAASNDFVAFESLQDASRACVRVSDQLGEMPVVDSVDPRVVAFLADACGYGVDAVPAGAPFEPPEVIIDETDGSLADDGELAHLHRGPPQVRRRRRRL